jgi:hypothetical protein
MAASPGAGPGACFKNQNYEIQGHPCNHCGGHAFWMVKEKGKGVMAQAKRIAAAASSAPRKKKQAPVVSTSSESDDDELNVQDDSAHESNSQSTVTDHSHKKSEVITQRHICYALDFSIFIAYTYVLYLC